MIIKCWSDFTCPFCYIAEHRLAVALENTGLKESTKIVFGAFELNPNAGTVPKRNIVEGYARHYGMSIEQARERVSRIEAMARGDGLVFNYGTAHATNTFDALRIAKLAQSKSNDLGNRFVIRMYEAFFGENLVMSDYGTLRRIAAEMGLDPSEVDEVLDGDGFAAEVRSDEEDAYAIGVQAVPFMVINGRYAIPGAIEVSDFERILRKAFDEEETEVSGGMSCGPDGCGPTE